MFSQIVKPAVISTYTPGVQAPSMAAPSTTQIHQSAARLLEGARRATAHLPPSRRIETFAQRA